MAFIKPLVIFLTSCLLFCAEISSNVSNHNGFNYIVKNNGNGCIKFSNPDYTFESIEAENGSLYK